ncbi:MAG TPA: ABC transporter substrate-binding protein [Pseudolabrys sp.]|nr:ABC transporter substrate-binding protein [Pseudolabrys sp.]
MRSKSVNRRQILAGVAGAGAAVLLPRAGFAEGGVSADKIVFGQAAALDGPAGLLGTGMRTGILAAFAEAGSVGPHKLELVSKDDGYEPTKSIEATKALIEQGVFALVGAVGTPTSMATLPLAKEANLPFIGPFTGVESLRNPYQPLVVNVRASYFQETEVMIERFTKDKKYDKIAILYQDDAFGQAGLAGVRKAMDKRGMKLVAEASFERNTVAVRGALLEIRKAEPQAVVLIGPYKPCAEFIKLAKQIKFAASFINISFVGSDALAKELGDAGAGVLVTQVVPFPHDASIPVVAAYQKALAASNPDAKPGFVSLEGYLVGRTVVAALKKVSGDPTRAAFLDQLHNGAYDLGGFTLTFKPDNNQGSNTVFLTELDGAGGFKPLTTLA